MSTRGPGKRDAWAIFSVLVPRTVSEAACGPPHQHPGLYLSSVFLEMRSLACDGLELLCNQGWP